MKVEKDRKSPRRVRWDEGVSRRGLWIVGDVGENNFVKFTEPDSLTRPCHINPASSPHPVCESPGVFKEN